jgi:HNH endonuclease
MNLMKVGVSELMPGCAAHKPRIQGILPMVAQISKRPCLYCDTPTEDKGKGEHIVPEALGGTWTLRQRANVLVCQKCNNESLSNIDEEFCRRSYVAVIASQELDAKLWRVWDVDESANNLLIEARPIWEPGGLTLMKYPQIHFDPMGPQIRCDVEEMNRFGREKFVSVLVNEVRRVFEDSLRGKRRGFKHEQVQASVPERGFRYIPRVYGAHTIEEMAAKGTKQYRLRYVTVEDRDFALETLAKIDSWKPFQNAQMRGGAKVGRFSIYFDRVSAMRGMMKIGLNLIAAYCRYTPVNYRTYNSVIRVIKGDDENAHQLLDESGFVKAQDIRSIAVPDAHSFRLVYKNPQAIGAQGKWTVYQSYFGGRIGAVVNFPGPYNEEWETLDIVAPVGSRDWCAKEWQIYAPLDVTTEVDSAKIMPSLNWPQIEHQMKLVPSPPKRKKG